MNTESASALRRIEVRPRPDHPDAAAASVQRQAAALGFDVARAERARVYFIEGLSNEQAERVGSRLLADPVVEAAFAGAAPTPAGAVTVEVHPLPGVMDPAAQSVREAVRDLTGVNARVSTGLRFDLVGIGAEQARDFAARALANPVVHQISDGPWTPRELPRGHQQEFKVRTVPIRELTDEQLVKMSRESHLFLSLDEMRAVRDEFLKLGREPRDIELETIAQTWSEHCVHKTLKSVVRYKALGIGDWALGEGEDVIDWHARPGHTVNADGSVTIENLLKSTIAAATFELIEDGVDWTLSVFKDNSGVVAFDDDYGVCIKVETHNRPSAIEPYGGAATGVGGCIRDVIGTGLGARPIANMDVFCVADGRGWEERTKTEESLQKRPSLTPDGGVVSTDSGLAPRPPRLGEISDSESLAEARSARRKTGESQRATLPPGTLHPRRILTDVVGGVRNYGNRMGIPTVNGAVFFDDRYVGNPLVYCGCVGLIPRHLINGEARPGDRIIALGGRTGRDGIHGATFSSAELESTTHSEFAHAVQIGNAIEEKRVLEAIMRARGEVTKSGSHEAGKSRSHEVTESGGRPLYNAMTDCGAGGFSSAIGEMGSKIGAEVHLDRAPLKYDGLSYTEIWISEAQERMILAVPARNVDALARICREEGVELADLGTFGTPGAELVLNYKGTEVGRLPMDFVHDGIPTPTREAVWSGGSDGVTKLRSDEEAASSLRPSVTSSLSHSVTSSLLALLAHPNIASKHWIVRQYDHEVQGNTVTKPFVGPGQRGPSDAAVIEPVPGSKRGIAIGCGLAPLIGIRGDPYQMALAGIDECVRNLVCAGADPNRIAILDNFCWPSCERPENLGALVRACEGCYDGAKAYRTPFVSGKDSLNNQLRYTDPATGEPRVIEIPCTLLISGLGIVPNVSRIVTMDAKKAGNVLLLIGRTTGEMGGSHYENLYGASSDAATIPTVDLKACPATAHAVAQLIRDGLIVAAHDCSDGGLLVAVAEMLIATSGSANSVDGGSSAASLQALLSRSPLAPLGLEMTIEDGNLEFEQLAFAESPGRYLVECSPENLTKVRTVLRDFSVGDAAIFTTTVGSLNASGRLTWQRADVDAGVNELAAAWLATLDW